MLDFYGKNETFEWELPSSQKLDWKQWNLSGGSELVWDGAKKSVVFLKNFPWLLLITEARLKYMSFILATVLDRLENTGYPVPLLIRKKEFRGTGILLYF